MTPKNDPPARKAAKPAPAAKRTRPKPKAPAEAGVLPDAPPPAPEGKRPVGKAPARKRSPQVAREMLSVEMRRIRSLFLEIGERYLADVEGTIVAVVDELEKRKLPMPCVERLLREVHSLSVKPRKGRRKDLARIESLVDGFRKTLED
ncbi:MAG TPA: hypothetical protein VIU29_09760 [Candidatus Deferrimicrobiaceae bacterium]